MEEQIKKIQSDLALIQERNRKVEADKAWETSPMRMISILFLTYAIASIVLYFIGVQNYLLSAVIPTLGYFLSTLSLPFIKKWWIEKYLN